MALPLGDRGPGKVQPGTVVGYFYTSPCWSFVVVELVKTISNGGTNSRSLLGNTAYVLAAKSNRRHHSFSLPLPSTYQMGYSMSHCPARLMPTL